MHSRLGIRSAYSLLYGVRMPRDIASQAAAYGARTLAITDRDNLYGIHSVLEDVKACGIRPVIGVELTAGEESVFAFVKNRAGFSRLCEILSGKQDPGFDTAAALRDNSSGLVIASRFPVMLGRLAGRVQSLYAAITPSSLSVITVSRKLRLPLAALDDAMFLDETDYSVHAVLRAVALRKTVGSLPEDERRKFPDGYFLPGIEFSRRFAAWPEAIRSADTIASQCTFDVVFDGYVFPDYRTETGERPERLLRRRVLEGAERRYGELSDAIMGRIEYELDIIERKGFAPYFLVMHDIVSMASRTCGRGSGAASIVSYALFITNVDPIQHRLYFERFLTIARPDPPDIDVDFAWDERDELIRRVIERFGREHCGRVANHAMFRPRSAFRETAKAYGFSEGEISGMERKIFSLGDMSEAADPPWVEIRRLADRIEGIPRGLSMHCGGLVITPEPIRRYCPMEKSLEGYPLLAWEKEGVESAGLVKLDLLGNRSLAVIRDTLADLSEQGIHIDQNLWKPEEDMDTVNALARGDSIGVFYIESPAMRQLQKKTGCGDFEHIVIHSSIIRPAANSYIAEYVRRLKGAPWEPLHPRLTGILSETYGILCYQEDVSRAAIALAGFDEVDADRLRKIIAKKAGGARLMEFRDRFFAGCTTNGVDGDTAKKVWDMMCSFDGYSFCKPHSASYAMVSFQAAFLRVHYPAPFMAAVLANGGGFYRPHAYISEARRMGLRIAGPDINRSRYRYFGRGDTVVAGFMAIASLSRPGIDTILRERDRNGPFIDLADAAVRLGLGMEDLVSLITAGAFDSLAPGIPRSVQAKTLMGICGQRNSVCRSGQFDLFSSESPCGQRRGASPDHNGGKRPEAELREEFSSLGFLRDRHPFALWERELSRIERERACSIPDFLGRRIRLLGWPVTQKEVPTRDGLVMDFISFEDETALFESVLFPEAYGRYRTLLLDQVPLVIDGIVKDDQGAFVVEILSLHNAVESRC